MTPGDCGSPSQGIAISIPPAPNAQEDAHAFESAGVSAFSRMSRAIAMRRYMYRLNLALCTPTGKRGPPQAEMRLTVRIRSRGLNQVLALLLRDTHRCIELLRRAPLTSEIRHSGGTA